MSIANQKDSHCYVCGPDNALGLQVPFTPLNSEASESGFGSQAVYTARAEHGGWSGILHGGVTFSLMDEALGWSLFFQGIPAVTAKVATRFHKPIRIGTELLVKAWVVARRRRLYEVRAEVRTNDLAAELMAEADAVMFEQPAPVALEG